MSCKKRCMRCSNCLGELGNSIIMLDATGDEKPLEAAEYDC